ncbi:MAG: SDR family NAD(P)-dependent oxidoreductase [Planctomycetes bacterium]|nr:SDR family NAD(P)-dependent oxidoreductase [Planctomycetota bacterium]
MNIILIGASSAIARALAREIGSGDHVILAGRDIDDLEDSAADIALRSSGQASVVACDISQRDKYQEFINNCLKIFSHIDGIFFCHGISISQDSSEQNAETVAQTLDVNITATCILSNLVVEHMRQRNSGFLVFISAIAADRGRQKDYIFGASKAALNTYVHGLQHRLTDCGVHALLVKPGPVDTATTWGHSSFFPPSSPTRVAQDIWRAVRKRKYSIYTPWYWRTIMGFIRCIPRFLYHRIH